jgi:hypothetical protein
LNDRLKERGTVHRCAKSRKQWDCAECPDPILIGQSYMFLNSLDEVRGVWSRYILCPECARVLNCHRVVEAALRLELPYTAGSLRREVKMLYDAPHGQYRDEFRKAWRVSAVVREDPAE